MGGYKIVIKKCKSCGNVIVKGDKEPTLSFRNRDYCGKICKDQEKPVVKVKK